MQIFLLVANTHHRIEQNKTLSMSIHQALVMQKLEKFIIISQNFFM